MNEEVVIIFFSLLAKGAKPTIFSSPPSQSIRRPKSILQHKASMIFHFGRRPSFPNNLVKRRLNKAEELQLVCGSRRVLTIAREIPRDIIVFIPAKVHVLNEVFEDTQVL
jgi:hypothetical protein